MDNNCLARTSDYWLYFLYTNSITNLAVFWKPEDKDFYALENGGKMYFYFKRSKQIYGFGRYNGVKNIMSVEEAWEKYKERVGQSDLEKFIKLLKLTSNGNFTPSSMICCIELEDINMFRKPVPYKYSGTNMIKKLKRSKNKMILKKLDNARVIARF